MFLRCLLVLCMLCVLATPSKAVPRRAGKPKPPKTTSCGLTVLHASPFMKVFASPGYPGQFSEQTQCTWLIEASKGHRVKVKMLDFSLVSDCIKQYVLFTDTLTGKKIGPVCGRNKPPEIVSAGNVLRIKLESNSVEGHSAYRGFKMAYLQTTDPASERLRDKLGVWRKYMIPAATLAPTSGPTDNVIDVNNNNKINDKNRRVNEENRILNEARSVANFIPVTETPSVPPQKIQKKQTTVKTTTFPGRWIPPKRTIKKPTIIPNRAPRPIYPKRQIPPGKTIKSKNSSTGNDAAKYIGITCGLLLLAVITFLAIFKWRKRSKKERSKSNSTIRSPQISTIAAASNRQPPPYRLRNYEIIAPTYAEKKECAKPPRPPPPDMLYTEMAKAEKVYGTKPDASKKEPRKTDNVTHIARYGSQDINGNHNNGKAATHFHSNHAAKSRALPRRTRPYEEVTETRATAKRSKQNERSDARRKKRTSTEVKETRAEEGDKKRDRARNYEKARVKKAQPPRHRTREYQEKKKDDSKRSPSRRRRKTQTNGDRNGKNSSKPRNKPRPQSTRHARSTDKVRHAKRKSNSRKRGG